MKILVTTMKNNDDKKIVSTQFFVARNRQCQT